MTKEEFEKVWLFGKYTLEDYERSIIIKDIEAFYDFRLATNIALDSCQLAYSKAFLGKGRLATDIESIKNVLSVISDTKVEYKLFDEKHAQDQKLNNDFTTLQKYVNNSKYWNESLDSMQRLYYYTEYRGLQIDGVLNRCPEYAYAYLIKELSPEKFQYWCKYHPNVNMDELEQQYNATINPNKSTAKQYTIKELSEMTHQQLDNIIQYGDPDPFKENEQALTQEELGKGMSLGKHPSTLLIFLLSIGLSASTVMAVWLNSMI